MQRNIDLAGLFRERVAPLVLWLAAVAAVALLWVDLGLSAPVQGFAAREDIAVAPLTSGRVALLLVAPGDRVAARQIIATLDPAPLEAELRVLEAERARVEADLARTQAEARRTGLGDAADRDADVAATERALRAARADLATRRAELAGTDRELARMRDLVQRQLLTEQELSGLTVKRSGLSKQVREAGATVALLERQAADATGRETLDPADYLQKALAPLEAELHVLDGRLLLLRAHRDDLVLRAPVGGQVTAVLVRAGEVALAAAPVARIVADNPGHVIACVPEDQLDTVALGAAAEVAGGATGATRWQGRAVALGPVGELPPRCWLAPNRPRWGREVHIAIDPPAALVPGESVNVRFAAPTDAPLPAGASVPPPAPHPAKAPGGAPA